MIFHFLATLRSVDQELRSAAQLTVPLPSVQSVLAEVLQRIVHYKSGAATGNTMPGLEQMQPPASAHADSSRPASALLS